MKFIKHLYSLKFTLWLLGVITVVSIIGTLFPQEQINIYRMGWFTFMLLVLGVSILLCMLKKRNLKSSAAAGSFIIHISIVLILLGGGIGRIWGIKGFLSIYEGQIQDTISVNNKPYKLPFSIELKDFFIEYYKADNAQVLKVKVKDCCPAKSFPVKAGMVYDVNKDYKVEILRYVPDFVIDLETKEVETRSNNPNNPAIEVAVEGPNGREVQWLFAKYPDMHAEEKEDGSKVQLSYEWYMGGIKDFKSRLNVIESGQVVLTKTIEVNSPLRYKGWTFYQSSYDQNRPNWTGLQSVKDPSVKVVYTGFFLLVLGMIVRFYGRKIFKIRG